MLLYMTNIIKSINAILIVLRYIFLASYVTSTKTHFGIPFINLYTGKILLHCVALLYRMFVYECDYSINGNGIKSTE